MSLTVKRVTKLIRTGEPGRFLDSGSTGTRGLHLCVANKNNASWGLRYQLNGRTRWMGLGSARDISLDKARQRAKEAREKLVDKIDPLQVRRAERASLAATQAKTVTFREAAEALIVGRRAEWKSAKHGKEFAATLERFAYPHIGNLNVAEIERPHVLRVLEQPVQANGSHKAGRFWDARTVTADRVGLSP